MKVVALVNTSAGAVQRLGAEAVRNALSAAFTEHRISATLHLVHAGDLQSAVEVALRQAESGAVDAVIVGGGDGTIRTAAGVLAATGVPIGILPLGTANHFATDLGLPSDLSRAVSVIAAAQVRHIDVAEVNGSIFINNSSIGIYPYMVLGRERRRISEGLPKWAAMLLAFLRVMHHFPLRWLTISAEGTAEPCRTPCLFVGNNQYGTRLFDLTHRRRLDVGELWLCVARRGTPFTLIIVAVLFCFGLADPEGDLMTMKVGAAEIRSRTSPLLVALDGEVESMRPPLRYRSRPGELTVIVRGRGSER